MERYIRNIICITLLIAIWGCSKKNEIYKDLVKDGEIHYPGIVGNTGYRAGNLRTQLVWNPSPDPKIATYKVFWNNRQDSLLVPAVSHDPLDTVKVLVPNLKEGTYNFEVLSIDVDHHVSITSSINGVRVYGPIYLSGIFNRGYNADNAYVVDFARGSVRLNFNTADSINLYTLIKYTDNGGKLNTLTLKPDSSGITLSDFQFGTQVTYQSTYIPLQGAIDVFSVPLEATFPNIKRVGDITQFYIKNPGNPFLRSDNGTGKWGLPKDWQYNTNVINQDGGKGGGWSSDNGGVIHFESRDWSGDGVKNGKVYQSFTLQAGTYALDFVTQGYGGNINAYEVVAAGTSLPDIDQLSSSNTLALFHGDQNSIGNTHTLSFSLAQTTVVTIGWVVSTESTTYLQFKNVKLQSL